MQNKKFKITKQLYLNFCADLLLWKQENELSYSFIAKATGLSYRFVYNFINGYNNNAGALMIFIKTFPELMNYFHSNGKKA